MRIFKLIIMNVLPVVVIHFLLLLYPSDLEFITLITTPFILIGLNFWIESRKTKSYFISNFFLILISSVLGVVISSYEAFGGYHSDYESYAIAMMFLKFNIIVSIVGSFISFIILFLKNQKKL
ncbi:hypothetical protein [Metabacillus fastidiosus]|uniref:hypothetical protein n=1 Tax=Metabacillus fastidiosus TaxID=1458 RepID=UPI002DB634C1|nr:hypothetical protein [Metabacillus fastidiosus]MEC2078458.1 hypothetical protein [Metabacillus fastidiosus]